jgi:hypothetical protein
LSSARLKEVEKRRTYQKKQTYWKEKVTNPQTTPKATKKGKGWGAPKICLISSFSKLTPNFIPSSADFPDNMKLRMKQRTAV